MSSVRRESINGKGGGDILKLDPLEVVVLSLSSEDRGVAESVSDVIHPVVLLGSEHPPGDAVPERVLLGPERPDPCLLTVPLDAGFVNVDDVGILDLPTNLLVLAATGARSALGRVPRGRTDSSNP